MPNHRGFRSHGALALIACLLADPRLVLASWIPSTHPPLSFTDQALAVPGATTRTSHTPVAQSIRSFAEGSLGVGRQSPWQAVPTIGLNVNAEDDEKHIKPAVREAMGEGRGLVIFDKGQALPGDIPEKYRDLVPKDVPNDLKNARVILIQPQSPQVTRGPPAFLWFDSLQKYMVADAGRGAEPESNPQQQIYIPQALVDRLLDAGAHELLHRVIAHEARHAKDKFDSGRTTENEAELQQIRLDLEPYLLADLEDWVQNLVTNAHGLSPDLDEVTGTLSALKRLALSLHPDGERTTDARRHLYETVLRAFTHVAIHTSVGDRAQQNEIVELAIGNLTALGEIETEEISWIKTLRNAQRNLERIRKGEIEVNLALLQVHDPEIAHDVSRERYLESKNKDSLLGNLNFRAQMPLPKEEIHTGSGMGVFQTAEMILKKFPKSRDEWAKDPLNKKIILNLLALSSGFGTRAGLLNVAALLEKGAIDLFDRTRMEQGLEQVLELLGDPSLDEGLPPGEYFMVVPSDNIILPNHDLAQYYRKGQGAHLFTLVRKVVGDGAGVIDLNAISEFGLVMQNKEDRVVGFEEKPKTADRKPDRLQILQRVLSQSITNHMGRGHEQEFYDLLWTLALPYLKDQSEDFRYWAKANRMELLMFPALLSDKVYQSLLENDDREGLLRNYPAAWGVGQKLLQNYEIKNLLQGIVDDAYLNTFYFLMNRPSMERLFEMHNRAMPSSAITEDVLQRMVPQRARQPHDSFWRMWRKRLEAYFKDVDWSGLVLKPSTVRGALWGKARKEPFRRVYAPVDWAHFPLNALEALKAGMTQPFSGRHDEFMQRWNEGWHLREPYGLSPGEWSAIGEASFTLLARPQGTLYSNLELFQLPGVPDLEESTFMTLKEFALTKLQEMGASWVNVKFGTSWRDGGAPRDSAAILQDANHPRIIRQMIFREHYGLQMGLADIKDSVIKGNVHFAGRHTVNRSVIEVIGGGDVEVGDNFVANHSRIVIYAPRGTTVDVASRVIMNHTELPNVGPLTLAYAHEAYFDRYFGGEALANPPEAFHARTVNTTLFQREEEGTVAYATYHGLAGAEEMESVLGRNLEGIDETTLQDIYKERGNLVDWPKARQAYLDLDLKNDQTIAEHHRLAALNPVEAHGFAGIVGLAVSAAIALHAPLLLLFALAPWMIAALGQEMAVIAHAVYERDWRILISINPIAVYDFNRQQEFGATSTFAHAHELARALSQSSGAVVPRLLAPAALVLAALDDVAAGLIEALPAAWRRQAPVRDAGRAAPRRPGLSFGGSAWVGIQAAWQNLNSRRALSALNRQAIAVAALRAWNSLVESTHPVFGAFRVRAPRFAFASA